MYIISIRSNQEKVFSIIVDSNSLLPTLGLLENSSNVLRFKISNSDCISLTQTIFGYNGFHKWVELLY